MYQLDDGVRQCCEERVKRGAGPGLASIWRRGRPELGPDAGEAEQQPAFLEREPNDVFLSCSRARDTGSAASANRANAATMWCAILVASVN
jgi:hypothetical protein